MGTSVASKEGTRSATGDEVQSDALLCEAQPRCNYDVNRRVGLKRLHPAAMSRWHCGQGTLHSLLKWLKPLQYSYLRLVLAMLWLSVQLSEGRGSSPPSASQPRCVGQPPLPCLSWSPKRGSYPTPLKTRNQASKSCTLASGGGGREEPHQSHWPSTSSEEEESENNSSCGNDVHHISYPDARILVVGSRTIMSVRNHHVHGEQRGSQVQSLVAAAGGCNVEGHSLLRPWRAAA